MSSRSKKRHFIVALLLLTALMLAPQAAFAAKNTDGSPSAEAVQLEAPQPVGGSSLSEILIVKEDPKVENASDLPTFKRNIINADPDSAFTRGVSQVGYDSLATNEQKEYYRALNEEAIAFMNAKEDLTPTQMSTKSGTVDVYVIAQLDFEQYGITDFEEASRAYYAYGYDHPAYYWISSTVWSTSSSIYLSTDAEYASVEERARINSAIDSGVKDYVALAEHGANTLDKIAMIHDKILTDVDYAYQKDGQTAVKEKWAHSVHGLFDQKHRKVVCEGYANTFSLIMNYMGIPNYYIIGMAGSGGAGGGGMHAWNAVSANDGKTYLNMDLTWDDLAEEGYFHKYFGMPSSDFEKSHFKYGPENTRNKWLYPITGDFNDEFAGTYYSQGDLYYDGKGKTADDIVAKGRTRAARVGTYASFMTSSTDLLSVMARSMGKTRYSYYTASYKGTDYYIIISPISDLWIDLSKAELALDQSCYRYTGDPIEPVPVVTCNGVVLIEDTNYTLSYGNNTEVSTKASVTATGKGNFTGSASKVFAIDTDEHKVQGHKMTEYPAVAPTYTEDGNSAYWYCEECKKYFADKDGYTEIEEGSWVIPKLKPDPIVPKGTTITKLIKGKKKMTVKWKKQPVQTAGYQIRYSLKKNFSSGVKTVTIKDTSTVTKVIKKLKSKKRYYVQIRTYAKSDDQYYYSAWSKTKSVKTK